MTARMRRRVLALGILIFLQAVIGFQNPCPGPSVWIVFEQDSDHNVDLAVEILSREVEGAGCRVSKTTPERLDVIPFDQNAIVLVGHGQVEGFDISRHIVPWSILMQQVCERRPHMSVLLACDSPSDLESMVFGFLGKIDAEAGALLAAWKIIREVSASDSVRVPLEEAVRAQMSMLHPLESYVYFIHGYFANDRALSDMEFWLEQAGVDTRYDGFREFSYWKPYWDIAQDEFDSWDDFMWEMHSGMTISDYADDFAEKLLDEHGAEPGVQIDIVAHSMGGLIAREMLRSWRSTLELYGIEIGRVITLGTPHYGTGMATGNLEAEIINLVSQLYGNSYWPSPVFASMAPDSPFMTALNANPLLYSGGINWYTVSGIDNVWGVIALPVHLDANDVIVARGRAHLSFAEQVDLGYWPATPSAHNLLAVDLQGISYAVLEPWLAGGIDTDGDGLTDAEERHRYCTDYEDSDSDNDGLTDGAEVHDYGTNPLAWSTDGDILSDGQEIAWGYDPNDTDHPIDAQSLTYSAWQVGGVTGYVRANHYSAIAYVKAHVKYKTSSGYWTSYMYVGSDNTPYYYGDYFIQWSIVQGYVQMLVKVQAYDSANHYLGSDSQYVTLPGGGGGGPLPE